MSKNLTLVLASTSPYRKKLLERLRLPFQTAPPHVDEDAVKHKGGDPVLLAGQLARQKAEAVLKKFPNSIVIGSDQMAVVGATVLDKPGTADNARAQLKLLAGNTHRLITAVCVLAPHDTYDWVEVTELTMRHLTEQEIDAYVAAEPALDCGGSYKIEGLGISLFTHIKGSDQIGRASCRERVCT